MADASSVLVNNLMSDHVSKSLIRRELQQQVTVSLEELSEHDREILLLRHAEELSNQEVASVLELDSKTASKRYGRALRRLSARLAAQGVSL